MASASVETMSFEQQLERALLESQNGLLAEAALREAEEREFQRAIQESTREEDELVRAIKASLAYSTHTHTRGFLANVYPQGGAVARGSIVDEPEVSIEEAKALAQSIYASMQEQQALEDSVRECGLAQETATAMERQRVEAATAEAVVQRQRNKEEEEEEERKKQAAALALQRRKESEAAAAAMTSASSTAADKVKAKKAAADGANDVRLPWSGWKASDIGKATKYVSICKGSQEWIKVEDEWRGVSSAPKAPLGTRNVFPTDKYELIGIERVQNAAAWDFYQNTRETIAKLSGLPESEPIEVRANEWLMKHGTRTTSPKDICNAKEGLDLMYANSGYYGRAIYMAEKASYSDSYAYTLPSGPHAGKKQMLLVKCSSGRIREAPTPRDKSLTNSRGPGDSHDSTRGPVTDVANPDMSIMLYASYRTYPSYIVTYTTK